MVLNMGVVFLFKRNPKEASKDFIIGAEKGSRSSTGCLAAFHKVVAFLL